MPRDLRQQMLHYSQLVYEKGWVANHDGNLTARQSGDRLLATPTAMSKADIREQDLIVVDLQGQKVSGRRRPFSELALHSAIYEKRPDVKAVIHAHPPYATAMAVAGQSMERPILAEAVVSLGDKVPLVPFALPKTPAWTRGLETLCVSYDALLLENHGVIAYGDDLEQAFLRLELVEHLARILHLSVGFGGPRYLDPAHVAPLLQARAKAGLGPVARGVAPAPVSHQPPTEIPRPAAAPVASGADRDALAAIIVEELQKMLR